MIPRMKGIHWVYERSKWSARVSRHGVRFFLGYFTLYKEACDAVKTFKDRHKSSAEPNKLKTKTTN